MAGRPRSYASGRVRRGDSVSGLWIGSFAALWVVVVVVGFLVLGMLRRIAPLLERAEETFQATLSTSFGGLAVGAKVPSFEARTVSGESFTDADLLGGRSVVLFLGSSCRACESFVEDLGTGHIPRLGARLVVVAEDRDSASELARATDVTVLIDHDRVLAETFDTRLVPRAFVVDGRGSVLAEGRPNEWNQLERLIAEGGGLDSETTAAVLAS